MERFLNQLEEAGIKERISDLLDRNPDVDIASVIEYEIDADEELEDVFLQEAHETFLEMVSTAIFHEWMKSNLFDGEAFRKNLQKFGEEMGEALNRLFNFDEERKGE